ncbi:MAG TPA: hypothetical protein VFA85_09460 [Terriglobales bacterium]|nr:hypothetical protein [Terriglobales bacterium]
MNIEIRNPDLVARLRKQIESTASGNIEEALLRLLDTQEEQDRWLTENRATIDEKIQRGLDQLDRGEGIPEDRLDSYLANLKILPRCHSEELQLRGICSSRQS